MPAAALGQPNLLTRFGILILDRPKTSSGPPIGAPEIFVPALCSTMGLLASVPCLTLLSSALVDESAFGFLSMLLR
jgi:hypothetical protein